MRFFEVLGGIVRHLICRIFHIRCIRFEPPPATCPISWQPSVLAPVFFGVTDIGPPVETDPGPSATARSRFPFPGFPDPFRLFFPSLDGAVVDAPILEGCARFPLIIFCHGHCAEPEHYKKWFEIPATLARSGYVVAVPQLPQVGGGIHPSQADSDLARIGDLEQWLRNTWEHRALLEPMPSTGIIGHSYGALLAGRYANNNQGVAVKAYASLSGVWQDWPDGNAPIKTLTTPKLFTWGDLALDLFTEIGGSSWDQLPLDKHRAVFAGAAHWDYLRQGRTSCGNLRGDCPVVGQAAGDLVATFFAKYLTPERWPTLSSDIPDTLIAPWFCGTFEQEFFAGSHLYGLRLLRQTPNCAVTLGWDTARSNGTTTIS